MRRRCDVAHVLVNTAKGRIKDKNMRVRGQVGIAISDPDNPYRYLGIQGRVDGITDLDPGAGFS